MILWLLSIKCYVKKMNVNVVLNNVTYDAVIVVVQVVAEATVVHLDHV